MTANFGYEILILYSISTQELFRVTYYLVNRYF